MGIPLSYDRVIIFGAGARGREVMAALMARNIETIAFCDNDQAKQGSTVQGIPVIAPLALKDHPDLTVVIAVLGSEAEIKEQLHSLNIRNHVDAVSIVPSVKRNAWSDGLYSLKQVDSLYLDFADPITRHMAWLQRRALSKNLSVRLSAQCIEVAQGNQILRISVEHLIYAVDIINSFDYYFRAVRATEMNGYYVVDYSSPRYHDVIGFDLMPVHFPSFSEPVATTQDYLGFAQLSEGDAVIDLGAYSGLTSMIFREAVGCSGQVVAVEADPKNRPSIRRNFPLYQRLTGREIGFYEGAVWEHSDGIPFSSEGNMGASVFGVGRGDAARVDSITLSGLTELFGLTDVAFVKCDIEGAEAVIFNDPDFFQTNRPRIVVEPHLVNGLSTAGKCAEVLGTYGYSCEPLDQGGLEHKLLKCTPR